MGNQDPCSGHGDGASASADGGIVFRVYFVPSIGASPAVSARQRAKPPPDGIPAPVSPWQAGLRNDPVTVVHSASRAGFGRDPGRG